MAVKTPETSSPVTVFYAEWCPFCTRLRKALNRTDTPYAEVNVEESGMDEVNEWIKSVNDGNRIVPTVLYSDGTYATNPPASDVRRKLEELS
ncbi:glutaredoxin [Corynebacterium phocae]|uniref:Glutaredoxin n=1 Tax=Corynebacterium phocae TaxID=161895 RepID=A0A1L7D4M0_9CORY|nr:glutaredoxin domain-containing protein [Corynebacterium phocae]APT93017.1 glutaredoxin [Corynebacterium phocae]KAA8722504.1 NrdH-redoxin [Corynebacterium phocae]